MLRAVDSEFNDFCMLTIDDLPYDQKMKSMEFVPVTSLMSVKMFAEYLNDVDIESADNGYVLPRKEDLYWDALMKEAGNG